MNKLIIVTLIWAFSFSLIGEFLKGVDSVFLAFLRVVFAFICFLPFIKFKNVNKNLALKISLIGAIQIGIMYIFYYKSFEYLKVYEVALFTIFTPFYVTLVYDILKLNFRPLYLLSVAIAVFGAFIIKYNGINSDFLIGFLYIQIANLCFGLGQSAYKFLLEKADFKEQKELFGYFFIGASFVTFIALLIFGNPQNFSITLFQFGVILWLSIVAGAIGYFLWNKGACEVDSGVLAIMNNALIPVAIIINLIFWQKDTDLLRLIIGSFIIYLSLILHKKFINLYAKKEN